MVTLQTETSRTGQALAPAAPDLGRVLDPDSITPDTVSNSKFVQITEKALKRIRIAMAKEAVSPEEGGLRLGITGGGCSGLSYNIRFDSKPRDRDRVYSFGEGVATVGDTTDAAPIRVFVDPKSFIYLAGMVLDFEETLMRQGFNFINPNSTKSCGCGSSFSA